ncbi:MAG: BsuPI-related putative proteinase inhibitor [Bacillota bacterium]
MNEPRHGEKGHLLLSFIAIIATAALFLAVLFLGWTHLAGVGRATVTDGLDRGTGSAIEPPDQSGASGGSGTGAQATVPVAVTVDVNPSRLGSGESATLTLNVRNVTKEPVTATFRTSLEADFTVESGNRVVWQWSRFREVKLEDGRAVLQPGQTLSFKAVWDGRDDSGRVVSPGDYAVKGVFLGQLPERTLPVIAEPAPIVVTP